MRAVAHLATWNVAVTLLVGLSGACQSKYSCGGGAAVAGNVLDSVSKGTVGDAFVVLETGGITTPTTSTAQFNPNFTYAIPADTQGAYSLQAVCAHYGVYAFAPSYHCATQTEDPGDSPQIYLTRTVATDSLPSISNVVVEPATAAPGTLVTLQAEVDAPLTTDPLSSLVLLLDMHTFTVTALNPPAAGGAGGFPNGIWQRSFNAPSVAGAVTYTLVAATQSCLTAISDVSLVVEP